MPDLGEAMSSDRPKPPRPTTPGAFPIEPPQTDVRARFDTERLLREYLKGWQQDQNEGNTIKQLREEVHDARLEMGQMRIDFTEMSTEQRLMRMRMDRHGKAIRELRAKVFHDEEREVDTDVHQVEDLKRHLAAREEELKERRDSVTWWKRKKYDLLFAVLGATAALGIGAIGTMIWYILTRVK
jgi:chromosome segregation ATPase